MSGRFSFAGACSIATETKDPRSGGQPSESADPWHASVSHVQTAQVCKTSSSRPSFKKLVDDTEAVPGTGHKHGGFRKLGALFRSPSNK